VSGPRKVAIVMGVAAAVVVGWSLLRGRAVPGWVTLSCEHMATTISVTVPEGERASRAGAIVSETFAEVDAMMSEWKPGSPLAAVNDAAGIAPVAVPGPLLEVIEDGVRIGAASGGAFDITWAALWGVWDFKAEDPRLPDPALIDARRELVDFRRVVIDHGAGTVYLPEKGMKVGLGGIAKGYAIDLAVERLRREGFTDFLLVSGGQVYAGGSRGGRPWRVGVRDPRGELGDLLGTVELEDRGISTSGDYERYFLIDGVRYHHILDPRTGWPSRGARAASVVSPRAMLADAVSTGAMVLGPERGADFLREFGVWGLIVDESGRVSVAGVEAPVVAWTAGRGP